MSALSILFHACGACFSVWHSLFFSSYFLQRGSINLILANGCVFLFDRALRKIFCDLTLHLPTAQIRAAPVVHFFLFSSQGVAADLKRNMPASCLCIIIFKQSPSAALLGLHVEAITLDNIHSATRWLSLASVLGDPRGFQNARCMSLFKSFHRCARYIIRCWLWASCHLPPIKTPGAPRHRSASSQTCA